MLKAVLLAEGSSDRALLPPLRWVVAQCTTTPVDLAWVDKGLLAGKSGTLAELVRGATTLCGGDLLFIHRDADGQDFHHRVEEIRTAAAGNVYVPVVPVREMEAWLLPYEDAIRRAAGRPSCREGLGLPSLARIEQVSDPKKLLYDALRIANGARGRRAAKFKPDLCVHRVAELVESDWALLRALPAFQRLERDTRQALAQLGVAPAGSPPSRP